MTIKIKIKKGDEVVVLTGRDKGKKGKVKQVLPKEAKVILENLNVVKRHLRPSMKHSGGIATKEMPIHISNVAYADPKSGEPTKIGYKISEDGKKVRYAKKSGEVLDK